jgi:hypothetical protein
VITSKTVSAGHLGVTVIPIGITSGVRFADAIEWVVALGSPNWLRLSAFAYTGCCRIDRLAPATNVEMTIAAATAILLVIVIVWFILFLDGNIIFSRYI